jgi:stage IV sporulation protein B
MQNRIKTKIFHFLIIIVSAISVCSSYSTANADNTKMYIAAGIPFGISIETEGVLVSGYSEIKGKSLKDNPAYAAGIKLGDIIISINGKKVESANDLTKLVNDTCGQNSEIRLYRENNNLTINVKTEKCDDGIYRLGINVKDRIAGIGTVTYICPEDNSFGGLGHGICDPNTGNVIPMKIGVIRNVKINNIVKGIKGVPGEIRGSFSTNRIGTAIKNSDMGVFGCFKSEFIPRQQLYEAASENDVKCGSAQIICSLDNSGPREYSILIESCELDRSVKTRNFVIKVTDKELINKTGGIIQGMSGSPIIQDGKLIGAVTHVLVDDPTRGYGIFIENMLDT